MWRLIGLSSSVVGLLCHALSPSFNRLIGGWSSFKFFLYGVLSLVICTTILFANQSSFFTQHIHRKTFTSFMVLMIISVYSFFYDKAVDGKPEILSLISNAAFALVSLSLSKLIHFGFEMGIFSYFLGCLAVQLWTINQMLILVAIIYGYPLFALHSSPSVARVMLDFSQRVFQADDTWRLVAFASSVVGLLCQALSPSYNRLIGGWSFFKYFLYWVVSLMICTTMLFAQRSSFFTQHNRHQTFMISVLVTITLVYSFFYQRPMDEKPEILSLVSNVAFALVSLSLSKLIQFGLGMSSFFYFLVCLAVQLWTIIWKLISNNL